MKLLAKLLDLFRGGRAPDLLARWLDVPEVELREWLSGHPPAPPACEFRYTRFTIPKRGGGERTIDAPDGPLKQLQRRILRRLLTPLPVHPAASGFVRGRSIVDNARPHIGQAVVINLDLANFFPSISAGRVFELFRALGWNRRSSRILANICTHEGRLPQGAPTSPALSNLVCRRLDARLAALAKKFGGRYTRYADDITLSFPSFGRNRAKRRGARRKLQEGEARPVSRNVLRVVKRILEEEGFQIQQRKKVRVQRAHQRQTATGLVVNRVVNLPRVVRRRVRAMQHHERQGRLSQKQKHELRGWEGLLGMVARQRNFAQQST